MGHGGGRRRLYSLITRYRAEIRADLAERYPGVDLRSWWRERRFRALLDLIDQLPAASRLNEAIQNDPEHAELIARAREEADNEDEGREPWSPRLAEYDLHAHLMRDMIQALVGVRTAVIAAAGGKPRSVPDYPTPVTEVDKATARLERAWAQNVLQQFGFDPEDF